VKPAELVGRTETKRVWAVFEPPDVTYFHEPTGEDWDPNETTAHDAAEDHARHVGGTLLLLTIESRITAVEEPAAKDAWVDGGMEGPCPTCGQDSGFHEDDGTCEEADRG
jgi:hypothetical protein